MEFTYDKMIPQCTSIIMISAVVGYVLLDVLCLTTKGHHFALTARRKRDPYEMIIRSRREVASVTTISGKGVTVNCPANGQKMDGIKWEKDGSSLPINQRQMIKNDGSLYIDDVKQSSDGGTYKCTFIDNNRRTKSRLVNLRVLDLPSLSPFEFPSDMQVGMRLRVMCSILKGDPPFYFSWLKDNAPLAPDLDLSIQYFRDYSMISSDSSQLKHAGNYTCVVNNEVGSASHSAILKINAPPVWDIEPKNGEVVNGKSVTLDCSAKGSPNPSILWRRSAGSVTNDYIPVYNSHKYSLHLNGSLTINEASSTEAGQYLCQAQNGYGDLISKIITLTVHEPPRFDVKFKTVATRKGDSAILHCEAKGNFPLKATWKKEGEAVTANGKYRTEATRIAAGIMKSELKIKHVTKNDTGMYSCEVKNPYGKDEARVKLLVQEVPGPPSNISIVNVTGRAVVLAWAEPFNGNSAISRYLLEYKPSTTTVESQNRTVEGQVTDVVDNLQPATHYNVRIKALNIVGWSDNSEWFSFLTEEETPDAAPSNVTARATGPNSVKISWEHPNKKTWNGHLQGYSIGFKTADTEEPYHHKNVDVKSDVRQETHLTNLRRATVYQVTVGAYNAKGMSPRSEDIRVKTLDDVPPSAPAIEVLQKTPNSITLGWSQRPTFGNPVTEYILHQRKENGLWKQMPISTTDRKFLVENLECGTMYNFYITAHNSVGKSEPSEIAAARTEGAAPLSPSKQEFITVTPKATVLNLDSWKEGGCPIMSFALKMRHKLQWKWNSLANVPNNQTKYVIKNIPSGTEYDLQVIASSSAGSTEATYEFRTVELKPTNFPRAPSTEDRQQTKTFASDIEIIVPVVVSGVVVILVLGVGCILCYRERQCSGHRDAPTARIQRKHTCEAINMKELAGLQQECGGYSDDGTQRSSSQSTSHYHGGPSGYFTTRGDEDAHPYATPYEIMAISSSPHPLQTTIHKLEDMKIANVYTTARQDPRDCSYEALMV